MRHARGRECVRVRVHARVRVHDPGRECVRARVHARLRVHARARVPAVIVTVAANVRGRDHVHATYANHVAVNVFVFVFMLVFYSCSWP